MTGEYNGREATAKLDALEAQFDVDDYLCPDLDALALIAIARAAERVSADAIGGSDLTMSAVAGSVIEELDAALEALP